MFILIGDGQFRLYLTMIGVPICFKWIGIMLKKELFKNSFC